MFEELPSREEIENLVGLRIRDVNIYQSALIHKSAVKLYNIPSYERLEFIGDSVLNMLIANTLYTMFPKENEGFMTKLRTRLVSGKTLSIIAEKMEIYNHIRMNEKALRQSWNQNSRILEDVFEALIGAIYLDQGLYFAKRFIDSKFQQYVNIRDMMKDTNYKDMLMRYTQQNMQTLPVYKIVQEVGPNHNKSFVMQVCINEKIIGEGSSTNKKQAEQNAAKNALLCIGVRIEE